MKFNAVYGLAAANVIAYFLATDPALMLWPVDQGFRWWQLFTYAFLHGNPLHLAMNMIALISLGSPLQREWGARRFLCAYTACTVIAGGVQLIGAVQPAVGASGAILGMFAAYAMQWPRKQVVAIFPMQARTAAILMMLVTLVMIYTGAMPGVAHGAHLGGLLAGVLVYHNEKPRP